MSAAIFPRQQLLQVARFSSKDITKIQQSHRPHNRLGFAYQLAFVRVHNRFPAQDPLEVIDALLTALYWKVIPKKRVWTSHYLNISALLVGTMFSCMANMFSIKTWSRPEKVSTEAIFYFQPRTFSHDSARCLPYKLC